MLCEKYDPKDLCFMSSYHLKIKFSMVTEKYAILSEPEEEESWEKLNMLFTHHKQQSLIYYFFALLIYLRLTISFFMSSLC